jgi:hypothetical protein
MVVHGKKVIINRPKLEESKAGLMIGEETTKALEEEKMKKAAEEWTHLEVYSVSEGVTRCKAGDKVFLSNYILKNPELVPVDGDFKMMVNEHDIDITW